MGESRILVKFIIEGLGEAKGELMKFLSPKTVEAILKVLPVEGYAAIWKEEVYFKVPVKVGAEKPRDKVATGDLAYWPLGSDICIFYGKSQPYSSVNLIGKITENLEVFKQVKEGVKISLLRC
ncbi:MAG: cyclophilin-like fold protein [Candidatus Bathyarchaeia archaeon]